MGRQWVRRDGGGGWWPVVLLAAVAVAGPGCSGGGRTQSASTSAPTAPGSFDQVLPPLPADGGAAKRWVIEHRGRLDSFDRAVDQATGVGDCRAQAEQVNRAVGPVQEWLGFVSASPDPALGQILVDTTQSVRAVVSLCAKNDQPGMASERSALDATLRLVRDRRRQLEESP